MTKHSSPYAMMGFYVATVWTEDKIAFNIYEDDLTQELIEEYKREPLCGSLEKKRES